MFSQATMTGDPVFRRDGRELLLSWSSTAPEGTIFQVYINRKLYWSGVGRSLYLPWPTEPVRADVGTVAAGEANADFRGVLPAHAPDRCLLTWSGGAWEDEDLASFRVSASRGPGQPLDPTNVIATVPFTGAGLGGWGMGGWGMGGWGVAAQQYRWTSGPLAPGVWVFAVAPVDGAGNVNPAPLTQTVTVAGPPQPPAAGPRGVRLTYTYDPVTRQPTLRWLAAPAP